MNEEEQAIGRLHKELRKLRSISPMNIADRDDWYRQARELEKWLALESRIAPELPHFFWHYLADADSRMKSIAYAQLQNKIMDKFLSFLEQGRVASDQDIVEFDDNRT